MREISQLNKKVDFIKVTPAAATTFVGHTSFIDTLFCSRAK